MFRMSFEWTVSVERSMKWEKTSLDNEENMTDMKERELNYKWRRQTTELSCKPLPLPSCFGNGRGDGILYRLVRWRANDRLRHAEQWEEPRERVSPVSINITLFSSSYHIITHTAWLHTIYKHMQSAIRLTPTMLVASV